MDIIGVGLAADDNTGDPLREAFIKCNGNFAELLSIISGDPLANLEINFDSMVQILASMPDTTANYGNSLASAVAAIGITPKTLWVPSDQNITADLVIPSTLRIVPMNGAIITIASSKTLTINSPFEAGPYQVFAGSGTVTGLKDLSPEWFGGKGDDSTDNTAAFTAMASCLNATGAGTITLQPDGIYRISPTLASTMAALTSLQGFSLVGTGATIKDVQTYTGTQTAIAFRFTACNNIYIDPQIKFSSQGRDAAGSQQGLTFFKFLQGCDGIRGGIQASGGHEIFYFQQGTPINAAYISKNIDLDIIAVNSYYPCLFERSGDNNRVKINATGCGRALFYFGGGSNSNATVRAKNSFGFLISSDSGGTGVHDVDIKYINIDSDVYYSTSHEYNSAIQFYNETPTTMRNIKLNFTSINHLDGTDYNFSRMFNINKMNNAGSSDTVARGHVLDGLEITGYMGQVDGHEFIDMDGAFASPDVVRNIKIHRLTAMGNTPGSSRIQLEGLGDAVEGVLRVDQVHIPNGVIEIEHTTGKTVFTGVTAQNLADPSSNVSPQDYYSCNITDGTAQSRVNKNFIHTTVGSEMFGVPNGQTIRTGAIADNGTYDLTLNGVVNQQGFLIVNRGGGLTAMFLLQGGNHTVVEVLDPDNLFSAVKDTAGFNVYWDTDKYKLQNKTGAEETAGVELTYFTRMD